MGFNLYVQCFKDGKQTAELSRKKVWAAFGPFVTESDPELWHLKYDEVNSCDVWLDKGPMITGFTLERPCDHPRLWESLLEILKLGNVVLYFPGEGGPVVTNESIVAHLPKDMIESLGEPKCITSGAEIQKAIK